MANDEPKHEGQKPEQEMDDLLGVPPAGFNADYAKVVLAWRESLRPRPVLERAGVIIALVASFSGAAVSAFNAYYYWTDRADRAKKEVFDNQITIAKTYFDTFAKVEGKEFCAKRGDALLFARTTLQMANLREDDVIAAASPTTPGKATVHDGVQAIAVLMYTDIIRRTKTACDVDAVATPAGNVVTGAVVNAAATAGSAASSYALQERASRVAPGSPFTVWIHYAATGNELDRARTLQSLVNADRGKRFAAPAVQAVDAVPNHDQIRIYHAADQNTAKALQTTLGLERAQIVNLESAFPNLPTGVIEVWLADPAAR